jgi:hypothetical protein
MAVLSQLPCRSESYDSSSDDCYPHLSKGPTRLGTCPRIVTLIPIGMLLSPSSGGQACADANHGQVGARYLTRGDITLAMHL